MQIKVTSVFVDDQAAALPFYTEVLGFVKKTDEAENLWLTVVSPVQPDGVELLLEPSTHPAVAPFRDALMADGIPAAQFTVDDVEAEYERLRGLGVTFTQEPAQLGPITTAVFDDTCGNLIQIVEACAPVLQASIPAAERAVTDPENDGQEGDRT